MLWCEFFKSTWMFKRRVCKSFATWKCRARSSKCAKLGVVQSVAPPKVRIASSQIGGKHPRNDFTWLAMTPATQASTRHNWQNWPKWHNCPTSMAALKILTFAFHSHSVMRIQSGSNYCAITSHC